MILVSEFGRVDRAGVTARAREIYAASGKKMPWGEARAAAYREAAEQLRAVPDIAINRPCNAQD